MSWRQFRRQELDLPREACADLGRSAVEAARNGYYVNREGQRVDWDREVQAACCREGEASHQTPRCRVPDKDRFPKRGSRSPTRRRSGIPAVRVARIAAAGAQLRQRVFPGGGFLKGARAQEEALCRSSALFHTLDGHPMYAHHRKRPRPDSTDWAIYSPDVPVFRNGRRDGTGLALALELPHLRGALRPYHRATGSRDLLQRRIHRVLAIARAVRPHGTGPGGLGLWAFENHPRRTAVDFRRTLEGEFAGRSPTLCSSHAGASWSPHRSLCHTVAADVHRSFAFD